MNEESNILSGEASSAFSREKVLNVTGICQKCHSPFDLLAGMCMNCGSLQEPM